LPATTATVEVLTAEVRTLKIGSRQVTLNIYRQLDRVDPAQIEPFGRVNDPQDVRDWNKVHYSADPLWTPLLYVIGRDRRNGALVRSQGSKVSDELDWQELPAIALAGMR
jgi:hypothetical protein